MADQLPDAKVLDRIKRLLNLAAKNDNEHESASAMEQANRLLTEYNLTAEQVSSTGQISGQRERQAIKGGFWKWQRQLWKTVAELNFCLHWTIEVATNSTSSNGWRKRYERRHQLIGKRVNIATTIAMAQYYEGVADRLTKERTRGWDDQYALREWSTSFKAGLAERLVHRMLVKRDESLKIEEQRLAELRAAGASDATALTLSTYIDRETDANIDFEFGEGTAARWAAQRVQKAEAAREAEQAQVEWDAAHPEQAAKRRAKEIEAAERRRQQRRRGMLRGISDVSAYYSGYRAGEDVSLDQQVDESRPTARIGRG